MPKLKISRSTLDRLRPWSTRPEYYFDTILPGFAVRVSPKGARAFVVQGYVQGVKHRRTLGRYPNKSPEDARKSAVAFLHELGTGGSPSKRATMAKALEKWLDEHGPKLKPTTRADYTRIVNNDLKPALGSIQVGQVNRDAIASIHRRRARTARRANYIVAVARSFFSWAEDAGYRPQDSNPAKRIRPYPEVRRERFLSEIEIGGVARAISESEALGEISLYAAAALRLALLTGARRNELTTLRWVEVDFERRMLRLSDSKTGRKPIWLSEPALALLAVIPRIHENPFVFPGSLPGQNYRNLGRAWGKVRRRADLEDVRLHDLRHTYASEGAASGLSLPLIGALLGHRVPATTARYAHLAAHPVAEANERIGARLAAMMRSDGVAEDTDG